MAPPLFPLAGEAFLLEIEQFNGPSQG